MKTGDQITYQSLNSKNGMTGSFLYGTIVSIEDFDVTVKPKHSSHNVVLQSDADIILLQNSEAEKLIVALNTAMDNLVEASENYITTD